METNKARIKKEVSCKTLSSYLYAIKEKKVDINEILKGIPYDQSYLMKRSERIEWNFFCDFVHNMRPYFSPSDFEEIGAIHVRKGFYPEGVLAGFIFFSSSKFSRMLTKPIIRLGRHMFSCIQSQVEHLDKNHIKLRASVADKYEFLPEFAIVTKGTWEQLGKLIGHKEFKVNLTWIHQGVIFDISWKREGLLFKFKRGVRWLFNIKEAFLDLTDSHEALLNQYNKLEESKALLQKQTTQLKIAHEITKSIRQSLDISKTLNKIVNTLVDEAKFSSVCIKLFKDIEGNKLEEEALSGIVEENVSSIVKPITTDNEEIGELIIYPQVGYDPFELNDLLNYLLPIINMSIHDSLVLRTVTDYKNNLETKVDERTAELKKAQDKLSKTIELLSEAQQAQNRFFTNISHEFRTPLTLILGPVKQIIERIKDERTKDELRVVHKNANSLLGLVNELLDISKLESGNMKLKASRRNIITLLKALLQSFCSYAERKRINLKFTPSEDKIIVFIDKEKIEKVVTNILSNAFKFTPEGGGIEISVKKHLSVPRSHSHSELVSESTNKSKMLKQVQHDCYNFVEISVKDTGIGIPKEKLSKIFDRFYQADGGNKKDWEGTGIGLALSKELIELHKGEIEVKSEEGKGTTFRIRIPLGKEHLKQEGIESLIDIEEETSDSVSESIFIEEEDNKELNFNIVAEINRFSDLADNPLLLIVEDNKDVRNYVRSNLCKNYNIIEAKDGEDGWNKSIEHIPDLIISDVMMPGIDGFELCEKLKTDERTSHIPVIMLTAKASPQDKIEGFETGADDYIMKPFETDELKARIKNLIEQRKRIHEHFRKHGLIALEEKKVTPLDQKFLQKAIEVINENISDPHFNVESFTEKLAIGRSFLNKKFVALVGEPPVEFIRRIRLNRAAELIEKKFGNMSEIALEVGFNNPAYFSECFRKQFGVAPSRYRGRKV